MRTAESVCKLRLSEPVDTVEPWCDDDGRQCVVVGTYSLCKETGTRSGTLSTIDVDIRSSPSPSSSETQADDGKGLCARHCTHIQSAAVLDCRVVKFRNSHKDEDSSIVIAACSDGVLRSYKLPELSALTWEATLCENGMLTALCTLAQDGSSVGRSESAMLAVSNSKGGAHIVRGTIGGCVIVHEISDLHWPFEAWCVEFGNFEQEARDLFNCVLYTGGDDGYLGAVDTRVNGGVVHKWKCSAHAGCGVTTLRKTAANQHELWSGGYDDFVRVWDVRALGASDARCVAECGVKGGVWRIRMEDVRARARALVACMYDGAKVLAWNDGKLEIHTEFRAHESIVYGAACVAVEENARTWALTGSFYDCTLHLWNMY